MALQPLDTAQVDFDALTRLFLDSRATAMPWLPVLHDFASTRRFLRDTLPTQACWLARDSAGKVLGFIAFDADWVNHLYLAPAAQGQGLGARLLALAQNDGVQRQLWCFADNQRARHFYERQGWAQVDATDGSANEERCPDVRYQWQRR
ncbi:N-acetyltransferase family protein [Chitinimonas sp.]|uniref:GNAT family N-acetyltransferase n=1 Tax=Chitinimonas sp. TaxID=1934313 RepID=UPI0035ADC81C